jgi:hypothetical protein
MCTVRIDNGSDVIPVDRAVSIHAGVPVAVDVLGPSINGDRLMPIDLSASVGVLEHTRWCDGPLCWRWCHSDRFGTRVFGREAPHPRTLLRRSAYSTIVMHPYLNFARHVRARRGCASVLVTTAAYHAGMLRGAPADPLSGSSPFSR